MQVFVGKIANVIMYDSVVAGQTDFLYGFGTLYISRSTLLLRGCGGGVAAWKGTDTTPSFANKYGVYVSRSRVAAANATVAARWAGRCSLGRPWNPLHRSVYMDTYLDGTVLPAGYTTWSGKAAGNVGPHTTMAVYRTYGPGQDEAAQRAGGVTTVLDAAQVLAYRRPADVFLTRDGAPSDLAWIDPAALRDDGDAVPGANGSHTVNT